jgi:hypothetical protein
MYRCPVCGLKDENWIVYYREQEEEILRGKASLEEFKEKYRNEIEANSLETGEVYLTVHASCGSCFAWTSPEELE